MTAGMTQALRQLAQLQEIVDKREVRTSGPMTEVELARVICFAISQAAHGRGTAAQVRAAKRLHYLLYGTPEIDLPKFGPKACRPIICIDGGKPNQVAPTTWPDAQEFVAASRNAERGDGGATG